MKKYILITLFITNALVINAQQLQSSSFYEMHPILHNPSGAGIIMEEGKRAIVGITYRTQWSGINGAPQTVTAFGSFNLPKQKIGIGGYVYNDKTGPTSRTGIDLSFAKHIIFTDGGIFSLGIETRFLQYSLDRAKLTTTLGADPALGSSDNRFKYDAGFGLSYTNKKIQIGASVSQLVQSKLDYYKGNMARTEEAKLYRHYYLHGKYTWNVDGISTITPNALVIYLPNAPIEFQGGAKFEYDKLISFGLGYRLHQNVMLTAGLRFKNNISIGYSYDSYNTPISVFDAGHNAHEFLLSFSF